MAKRSARAERFRRYLDSSRMLASSYVFVAPLVALYEIGVAVDPRARNGAEPIFRELLEPLSHLGLLVLNLVLLGLLFLAIWHTKAKRSRLPGLYGQMVLESCLWALVLLVIAHLLPPQRLALPIFAREMVASIGAGIYEEALFRLLLLGGLILILQRGLGGHPGWVVPLAVVASALLFSLAHHEIGGEPWDRGVFLFRAMMGALLGVLFWARGLGIVVYAHALYNVALVLRHA